MRRWRRVGLSDGDVREIVVVRHQDHVRLAVYQGTEREPLIQAILLDAECLALIRALGGS